LCAFVDGVSAGFLVAIGQLHQPTSEFEGKAEIPRT
jgi:hypothetical protein